MMSDLLLLPFDIIVHILKKLRLSDLRNVMLTCKSLRNLIMNDNSIWRSFTYSSIILHDIEGNRWCKGFSWYDRIRISRNWHTGCYKCKEVLRHYTNYMPWLNFYNSEFLLLTMGSELACYKTDKKGIPICTKYIWKVEVPKMYRHDVRTNDISRFVVKNNLIICGNRDGCVSAYRWSDMQKSPRLVYHLKDCHEKGKAEVTAVEVIENRNQLIIYSGSSNSCDLKLCTINTERNRPNDDRNVVNIPLRDCTGIKCLSMNKTSDCLAVGLKGNSEPLLIDASNAKMLLTAEKTVNHRQQIRDIQWHNNNTIVYVSHSGFLKLLDTRINRMVYRTRDPFQSTLYCVKTDNRDAIVVGAAEYSRCVLFDGRNPKRHVQLYFTQRNSSPVYSLDFDSTKLITAVDRGVAVLNFNIDSGSQVHKDYSDYVFS